MRDDEEAPEEGLDSPLGPSALSRIPDVRDGLTRVERIVIWQLGLLQAERGERMVPTAMLYGRVSEHVDITPGELSRLLARLGARGPR